MYRKLLPIGYLSALLCAIVPVSAAPAAVAQPLDPVGAGLLTLQALDKRVAAVGHRLAMANRELCARQEPIPGFSVHHVAQYAPAIRGAAIARFGLTDRPSVLLVVPGGAAAEAGLMEGDILVAFNGRMLDPSPPPRRASFGRVKDVEDALETALAAGPVIIDYERAGERHSTTLPSRLGCVSRVQVIPSERVNAAADGEYVQLTSAIVEFARTEDELAVVIAHEMAHNIMAHRARLKADKVPSGFLRQIGVDGGKVKETEIEADYWATYLAARAGYDAAAAPGFWARLDRRTGTALFGSPTHPTGKKRINLAQATVDEIAAKRAAGAPLLPNSQPPPF